jgi:serine beta-lactamase-like protein LACTB
MSAKSHQTVLTVVGVAGGVVIAAALGVYSFLHAIPPLHPNLNDVPAVIQVAPAQEWAGAVEQGRHIARAGLIENNLPGLSVAVGARGEIVWAEGFGWADLEKRLPVAPGTRFRIGHVSKALTSAAVGLLVEDGRLRLDDEIQTYVPAFPTKQWPITVRQLMGHTAGVRHYRNEGDYTTSAHCDRAADGLKSFANDPLLFEPGTEYRYSTFGWVLVSAAIETAAGEPFFTFMRKRIFEPLVMADTTPDSATEPTAEHATFYYPRVSGDPSYGPEPATPVDYSCFAGAGAFLSTPSDLVRFGLALNSRKLLQPPTVRKFQTPQLLASGVETDYGLGWMLETVPLSGEPTPLVGHASRTLLGGSTSFMTFPERGLVVVVMSNISKAETRSIALRIAEAFAEQQVHLELDGNEKKVKLGS